MDGTMLLSNGGLTHWQTGVAAASFFFFLSLPYSPARPE